MNTRLSPNRSRQLALGLLIALIVLIAAATVLPLWLVNAHYAEQIDSLSYRLSSLQRIISNAKSLEPVYDRLQKEAKNDRRYLRGQSEALAAAELQRLVKKAITPTGGDVISTQIMNAKEPDPEGKVTLKVRMRGNLDAMVNALYKIETGYPLLFLDKMSIRSRTVKLRLKPTKSKDTYNQLDVEFQVYGYLRST